MLYCTTCLNQGDMAIQAAWRAHLVKSLWQYSIDQWIAQNEYICGKTKEEQAEKRLEQSLERIQKWVECVTIAYEAWVALKVTQASTSQHHTSKWSMNVGRHLWV